MIFTNQQCPEGQEGIFYAVDKSPNQYKHCGPAGFFWIFPCSPGTYFNQVEQACLLPPNATTTTDKNQIVTKASSNKSSTMTPTLHSTTTTTTVLRTTTEIVTVPTTASTTVVSLKTTMQDISTSPSTALPPTKSHLPVAATTTHIPLTSSQQAEREHESIIADETTHAPENEHRTYPTFSAAEPKLFVTAGPHIESEDYYETYDGVDDGSHSQSSTLIPTVLAPSTPQELEYWGDNTAESPPIPLHPRISSQNANPNINTYDKDNFSLLGSFRGNSHEHNAHANATDNSLISPNPVLPGANIGEHISVHTAQSPSIVDETNAETPENMHTSFVPLEQQPPPVNHQQPGTSEYDEEHIYEYHVVPPPTEAYEVTQPPHEPVQEEQPNPTHIGESGPTDAQQPINHYESGTHSGAVHEPGFAWSSYESGTYMEPHSQHQVKESEQSVPPPIYGNEYYVNPTEPHPITQAEYPQDETSYVRTVPPDTVYPKVSQHNQESLILQPQGETDNVPYIANNIRTSGPKSLSKTVTLSPMAMELRKRISDEDLASMQRVFQSIAAQVGPGGPGGRQLPPHVPREFLGGNASPGFPEGNVPSGFPGGGQDYSQFLQPPNGYVPQPVRPPPITEIPPTIIMVPSCKENGTCEFNAVIETYCMHEDPTYYYQCGPSADDIGIWMVRQCPAGLQLNSEGQCGKRQKGGSGVKNPSPNVQPVPAYESGQPIASSVTSGWSQQNVQQPLETYEEHSKDTKSNIYPAQIANPSVTAPIEQPYVNPKQPTYTNVETPYQPAAQSWPTPANVQSLPNYSNVQTPYQPVVYPKPVQPKIHPKPAEETVENSYEPNLPPPYQPANNQQPTIYSTGKVDKPAIPPTNNYVQFPRPSINEINNPSSVDPAAFVNSLKPYANQNGNDQRGYVRTTPVAHWVVDQQQTKNPYIQPRVPYQPQKSITTVRGGSLPQSVVAKLANLDSLAQAIAAKNVYHQGQQSQVIMPKSANSPIPFVPGQNPYAHFGTNYLSAGHPQSYGPNSNSVQNMNAFQFSNFNGNTAGASVFNMQNNGAAPNSNRIIMPKSIPYGMNPNQPPNNPRYPYPDSRPYSTSRDATPLTWHSNESVDKPTEPVYVWRPAPGQRCSLLASPKAQVFSNPDDYKSFFMCTLRQGADVQGRSDPNDGTWALLQCPEDTIFNTSLKVCDRSFALHSKQRKLPK